MPNLTSVPSRRWRQAPSEESFFGRGETLELDPGTSIDVVESSQFKMIKGRCVIILRHEDTFTVRILNTRARNAAQSPARA